MKKFDFSADEMNALLYSLISHRKFLKKVIDSRKSPVSIPSYYDQELQTVESLMEKLFPGSIKAIDSPRP